MRLLILGGTAWLGRAVARSAIESGHETTCLARGTTVADGAALIRADRDRDDALRSVATERWDAVIDLARGPGQVRRAVRDLEPAASRYVFVSTVSVYASHADIGADETAARLDPLDGDTLTDPADYGRAKVACEDAVLTGFGAERSAIVRAGLIGGPGDPSGRTGYWPTRFARPSNAAGAVLAPDVPELPTGVIDVRDLAVWLVRLAEGRASGAMDAVGHRTSFDAHLETARRVTGHRGEVVRAPEEWLVERGIAEWSGPRSLPLWLADPSWYGVNARSNARALAGGLALRPLAETLLDSLPVGEGPIGGGAGLSDEDERDLLAELRRPA